MRSSFSYRRSGSRRLIAATVLVALLFLIDSVSGGKVRNEVRAFASFVSVHTSGMMHAALRSGFFSSRAALEAKNQTLEDELALLKERAAGYDAIKAENEQLRALVHLAADSPGVTAPVISSLRSSPYGTFLIGAGSEDGIVRGSLVLTSGGFVAGEVGDAGPHTAVVLELFGPHASLEGIVHGASLFVAGEGGGNARAKAPRELSISVGDTVVAPGVGERPVGVVGALATSSASASQDVYIVLPVNLSSLQYVYIIPPR